MQSTLLRACRQVLPFRKSLHQHRRGVAARCSSSGARRSILLGLLAGSIHTSALAAQPAVVMAAGNPDIEKVGGLMIDTPRPSHWVPPPQHRCHRPQRLTP